MISTSSRRFACGLAILVAAYGFASLQLQHGVVLVALGNLGQCVLLAICVGTAALNVRRGYGQGNSFWLLTALGFFLWFCSQGIWTYYESYLRIEVPDAYGGDVLFFFHTVPLMAAALAQLHAVSSDTDSKARFGYLDLSLLLLWWIFLYAYIVGPWEFVQRDEVVFGPRFNILYALENLTLIACLGWMWLRATQNWKRICKHLFLASVLYCVSSLLINVAIDEKRYYTGSLYDLPLVVSMAWCAYAGFLAYRLNADPGRPVVSMAARWNSRFASLALFTMPLFIAWAAFGPGVGPAIQRYRIMLTVAAMLLLVLILCFKEELLHRRLVGLVLESRKSLENLQRLQEDLVQTEKLAAVGRLVSGAAHEINNPLTAILGYADLLAHDASITDEHRQTADKIRQQARRTKTLVASLLTFAQQSQLRLVPLDMNLVVANALQLRQLDLTTRNINIMRDLEPDLPEILGDQDRLLQVCFHIFNNAADAMVSSRDGVMAVSTRRVGDTIVFRCADNGPGITDPKAVFDPFYTTKAPGQGTGLGLSACYGIVNEHGGQITCENGPAGGAVFTVTLPVAPTSAAEFGGIKAKAQSAGESAPALRS